MSHAQHAITRMVDWIQRNGKDSEGKPVESLKEAEEIASLILNQMVTDNIFSQVVQEAIDGERFSPTE